MVNRSHSNEGIFPALRTNLFGSTFRKKETPEEASKIFLCRLKVQLEKIAVNEFEKSIIQPDIEKMGDILFIPIFHERGMSEVEVYDFLPRIQRNMVNQNLYFMKSWKASVEKAKSGSYMVRISAVEA